MSCENIFSDFLKELTSECVTNVGNYTKNAAVAVIGGLNLAVISTFALKALGFTKSATIVATALPISMSAILALGVGVTTVALINWARSSRIFLSK